jgi:serine protease AprX
MRDEALAPGLRRTDDPTPMLRRLAPALAALLLAARAVAASPDPRIADWAWDLAAGGAEAPVIVLLRDQADLSAAAALPDRLDRRRFVHLALTEAARRSQPPLAAWLDARGIAHRDFFVVNAVALRADRARLLELARRDDVALVAGDPETRLEPVAARPAPKAAQWNVAVVGAPAAWAEGHDGEGIVVGVQDTGMRWTHEALRTKYRGWDAGAGAAVHDHSWRDAIHAGGNGGPCGTDSLEPCDDSGHGTHVTGTAVGGDAAGDALGVAPGARWIGCRDMDVGWGSPSRYLECFEFFLAPTDLSGDPATGDPLLAPDVTSNSWACPPAEAARGTCSRPRSPPTAPPAS